MDEDLSIINSNTRNEKIKNFFVNNKNKLIFFVIILIITIAGVFSYDKYLLNKKKNISDNYNSIIIDYSKKNKEKTTSRLIEIINKKDPTYSPLSLYFIIDKSSSITKSYSLIRTEEYLHFYNTLIHFLYQFCIKF